MSTITPRLIDGHRFLAGVIAFAALGASLQAAAETVFQSGSARAALVELYTSEGCSSCPPADRWMSSLKQRPGLWTVFVPLSFHVDYWDYIGWRDRYATPAHGERQRRHAEQGRLVTVYTPAFVVDGQEWRGWRAAAAPPGDGSGTGVLSATVDGLSVSVRYVPAPGQPEPLAAHAALLGFDLESDVTAGENTGRRLVNDFVVLGMAGSAMTDGGRGLVANLDVQWPEVSSERYALAVWVTPRNGLAPLQAAGGWLGPGAGPEKAFVPAPAGRSAAAGTDGS